MVDNAFHLFQSIAYRGFSNEDAAEPLSAGGSEHPFDTRNMHTSVSAWCKKLFDDGHYQEAIFKAFKMIEVRVKRESGGKGVGFGLMMSAFDEANPSLKLTPLTNETEIDEQRGFRHLFAGAFPAIRNPRGHDDVGDTIDDCLDHLSFASYLLRRLDRQHL